MSNLQRVNFYTLIHKALRYHLYQYAMDLGQSDFKTHQIPDLYERFLKLKYELKRHAAVEDKFLHPFMEQHLAEDVKQIEADHQHHDSDLAELEQLFEQMQPHSQSQSRQALGQQLYLKYNLFVAKFVEHLHLEEFVVMPKLWTLCSDEALMAPHKALMQSISPDEFKAYIAMFMPAINTQERSFFQR